MKIEYEPIGVVHSPFTALRDIPRQPSYGRGIQGSVVLQPNLQDGLRDLIGFSHIILLCHFHKSREYTLDVFPPGETGSHGLFATRSPRRPNPIGMSMVRLLDIEDTILTICDLDILDGTPVLDIKPYCGENQSLDQLKTGWMEK